MRKVTIREFSITLWEQLKNLPAAVTRYGGTIAVVRKPTKEELDLEETEYRKKLALADEEKRLQEVSEYEEFKRKHEEGLKESSVVSKEMLESPVDVV